jgi:hypothetical protein
MLAGVVLFSFADHIQSCLELSAINNSPQSLRCGRSHPEFFSLFGHFNVAV